MILWGTTLKVILKRDVLIEGGINSRHDITIMPGDVEKCTKPGLYKIQPHANLISNAYGMLIAVNPVLFDNCEISGPQFIPPHSTELPAIYVRPATKDFNLEGLEYLYKLTVLEGKVKQ